MNQRKLQQLSGLVDFEVAARWSSFRLAALELHKTPAAVSQQIKQLEQTVGFALFTRHARRVVLTARGQALAATASRVLGELNAAVAALQTEDDETLLVVSATHSFAMKWLVPRLPGFTQQYPQLDLRVESSDQLADLDDGRCDMAIRYQRYDDAADDGWLCREQMVVVYSATLGLSAGAGLGELARYPLLCEDSPEAWLAVMEAAGVKRTRYDFSARYSHAGLLVQAAVAGHGVALVPLAIAYEDLAAARLLLANGAPIPSRYGYRLLRTRAKAVAAKHDQFAAWLQAEMGKMQDWLAQHHRAA